MEIDNLELIIPLLKFDSSDDFYHLQILKRKKENKELGSNSYVVKTYYISSVDYLQLRFPEIKCLCQHHNARAMINLNRRSFERLAFQMLKKVTDRIISKDFKSVRKSYESVCGQFSNEKDKRWIVDIDTKDPEIIANIISEIPNSKYDIVPTVNGVHLITSPFRLDTFKKVWPDIDVHKNNPTLLYYNKQDEIKIK